MDEYAYIEFLIEDESGRILVNKIMEKYSIDKNIGWKTHAFGGIGHIPKKINMGAQVKTHKLLNDLPNYLAGMGSTLVHMSGKAAIFVVLDCDDKDCVKFKQELLEIAKKVAFKCECASNIGAQMDIQRNISPSFRYFIRKMDEFCMP